jgi:hypothetical protein
MLGFLIENGHNERLVHTINTVAKMTPCIVFSETLLPHMETNVMQKYEMFHFNGSIITNSFRLAQHLKHLGYCKKRYYYVQSYDWMKTDKLPYYLVRDTLLHPNIDLVAGSVEIARVLKKISDKSIKIVDDWNVDAILRLGE